MDTLAKRNKRGKHQASHAVSCRTPHLPTNPTLKQGYFNKDKTKDKTTNTLNKTTSDLQLKLK